ncbi:unnamed protein product [Acanthosepion pharaonis]|uniref:Uncharacterized protein n=1 Tax=Acanthosepion pharaonis TaxID=158019 RepID=A0A812CJ59_ACAPH|nr:unnamed protein product [Sepia pharaonis]
MSLFQIPVTIFLIVANTEGFRDGVTGGQDEVLQNSFDSGYTLAAKEACELGRIQGQISALLLFNRHKKHGQLFGEELSSQFKQLLAEINSYKMTYTPPAMSLTCNAKERINEAVFVPELNAEAASRQYMAAAAAAVATVQGRDGGYLQTNHYIEPNMYDYEHYIQRNQANVSMSVASQNIARFKDRFQRLLQMCDGTLVARLIT